MAALHRSGAAVPAEYMIGDEVRTVHQWADQLAAETPPAELLTRYRALVERVEAAASTTTLSSDSVIHRDLHEEHLFIDPDSSDSASVGVIDLDEARRGDPVVDLAHLAVHLHLATGTAGTEVRSGPFRGVEEAWRHGTGRTPALDGFAIQVAFTALKIARQRALGYGTRPRPVGADRWPETDRVLRLGEAWIRRAA
jgi:aminoglycoside phosphotransferase (APT) family kinase protein